MTLGVEPLRFIQHWESDASKARLESHWDETRRLGLTTYPTIAVRVSGSVDDLITGFADSDTIVAAIRRTVSSTDDPPIERLRSPRCRVDR